MLKLHAAEKEPHYFRVSLLGSHRHNGNFVAYGNYTGPTDAINFDEVICRFVCKSFSPTTAFDISDTGCLEKRRTGMCLHTRTCCTQFPRPCPTPHLGYLPPNFSRTPLRSSHNFCTSLHLDFALSSFTCPQRAQNFAQSFPKGSRSLHFSNTTSSRSSDVQHHDNRLQNRSTNRSTFTNITFSTENQGGCESSSCTLSLKWFYFEIQVLSSAVSQIVSSCSCTASATALAPTAKRQTASVKLGMQTSNGILRRLYVA